VGQVACSVGSAGPLGRKRANRRLEEREKKRKSANRRLFTMREQRGIATTKIPTRMAAGEEEEEEKTEENGT